VPSRRGRRVRPAGGGRPQGRCADGTPSAAAAVPECEPWHRVRQRGVLARADCSCSASDHACVVDGITAPACRGGYTASACDDQVEAARRIGSCCVLLIRFDVAGSQSGAVVLDRSIVLSASPSSSGTAHRESAPARAGSAARHRMSDLHVKLRSDAHWLRRTDGPCRVLIRAVDKSAMNSGSRTFCRPCAAGCSGG